MKQRLFSSIKFLGIKLQRNVAVGTVTKLLVERPRNHGSIPGRRQQFCLQLSDDNASRAHPVPYAISIRGGGGSINLNTLLYLIPNWRVGGAITSLRHTLRLHEQKDFTFTSIRYSGPGSVVGIATGYGLDGQRIESPWGARFSAIVQTGPGAQLVSCTMGTGSFLGVKGGRGGTLTPHLLLVPWT
jgi:hypothetical protein